MSEENPPPITPATTRAEAACGRCGRPGAAKFGDEFICDDCYVACGSCCAGEEAPMSLEPSNRAAFP